jgi:hypothetical protein
MDMMEHHYDDDDTVVHESDYTYSLIDATKLYYTTDPPHFKTSFKKGAIYYPLSSSSPPRRRQAHATLSRHAKDLPRQTSSHGCHRHTRPRKVRHFLLDPYINTPS